MIKGFGKKMKKATAVFMAALMLVLMCACGGNPIVGTWKYSGFGEEITITFNKDGSGKTSNGDETIAFDYKADGDKLVISAEGEESDAEYSINGDTLAIDIEGQEIELKKVK